MPSQHYALTSLSDRLVVTSPDDGNPDVSSSTGTMDVRSELDALYQTYAEMYPNPRLSEEARERDKLLEAASAAANANASFRPKKQSKRGWGVFSFLGFGSSSASAEDDDNATSATKTDCDQSKSLDEYEGPLIYTEQLDAVDGGDNDGMCGTTVSLDTSCIPDEAYTVARFHLTSTRARRGDQPNAVRRPAHRCVRSSMDGSTSSKFSYVIVGLGRIAEFPIDGGGSPSRILTTSDRDDLLAYSISNRDGMTKDDASASVWRSNMFRLEQVRAVSIGTNCLAVSWGFEDGLVVFYRRMELMGLSDNEAMGWHAVWMLGPSQPVLEDMSDVFQHDSENSIPGSPLMKVSDMIPLMVEAPTINATDISHTAMEQPATVATLAIARLGGFIEFVPLPTPLWYGGKIPMNEQDNIKRNQQRKGKRKRRQGQHYALGSDVSIGVQDQTVVLSTWDYHGDIMCLEAFRTEVTADSEWDTRTFPESPPSEFVVAATGTSKEHGQETVTFWSVSTIFTDEARDIQQQQRSGHVGFQLHSALIEAVTASSGSDVSIFASPNIMKRWRTPRNVQLRPNARLPDGTSSIGEHQTNAKDRVTTISTSAPIVTMRFFKSKLSFHENQGSHGPYLAILDWNGSVTIMDCSLMERLASQTLSQHEYDMYRNANDQTPFPLATTVVKRKEFTKRLRLRSSPTKGFTRNVPISPCSNAVTNLHWLEDPVKSSKAHTLPPLALLMGASQRELYIASFCIQDNRDSSNQKDGSDEAFVTTLAFPGNGAAIESLVDGQFGFLAVAQQNRKSKQLVPGGSSCLKFFVMQQLQPLAIIESLARAGKYKEAIEAAGKLSDSDQNEISALVHECFKQLWEKYRDVACLAKTNDVNYIVNEVAAHCMKASDSENRSEDRTKLGKLRSMCIMALDKTKDYIPRNSEDRSIEEITTVVIKLGTYELICAHLTAEASYMLFHTEFLTVDLVDLAETFARTADILALSTLFFRHARDLVKNWISILDHIPLSMDPYSYRHLLPIIREDGRISDCFLSSTRGDEHQLHWSQIPHYLKDNDNHSVVLDRRDETIVLDFNKRLFVESADNLDGDGDLRSSVATWFVSRACKMQTFVGNLPPVILLCEFGLRCTMSSDIVEQTSILEAPRAVQQLYRTWKSACSLQSLLAEGVLDLKQDRTNSIVSINTSDMLSMDLVDIVALVLHGETDCDKIQSKCATYLQPLLMDVTTVPNSATNVAQTDLDQAFTAFCLGLIGGISEIEGNSESDLLENVRNVLATCAAITSCSTASTAKANRLIKDLKTLCEMIFTVFQEISATLAQSSIAVSGTRAIIDLMWVMYEAMPDHIPESKREAESWLPLLKRMDVVFQDLVGVDILSRWHGCRAFAFYRNIHESRVHEDSNQRVAMVEIGAVAEVCQSFCSQVRNGRIVEGLSSIDMLHDLISDLEQLVQACFEANLPIGPVVCEHLVTPLLRQEQFHLVAEFLLKAPSAFVERQEVAQAVLSFTDEAVFSSNPEDSKIRSAIRCQDVLGPAFPDVRAGFKSVRRFLDAANFINTVIYDGKGHRKPFELRCKLPLDVIESVLLDHPSSVICGCPEWSDPKYAFKANKKLRDHRASNEREGEAHESSLPSLPGGAIFHLATILGLEDDISALVVKCRVSHHAIGDGLYGAAAAICRTLVCTEKRTSLGSEPEAHAKLSAVAELVSAERYDDIFTKKELSSEAIKKFSGELSFDNSCAFDAILRASMFLDQRTSLFSQETQMMLPTSSDAALARPIARLFNDIRAEYNADVHALFSDLLGQTSQGEVHDSLMNALSRFVIYWSVSDSIKLKSTLVESFKSDAKDVLALGCSLILHIPSQETALNCIDELLQIAIDQAATVATEERFGSSGFSRPDPDIVKQLLGMGYSENGARRSAVVTQNSGLDAALAWAMTHSSDRDFNDPFVVLKIPNLMCIDEDAIQALQKSLFAVKSCLEEEGSMGLFLRKVQASHKLGLDYKTSAKNSICADTGADTTTGQGTTAPLSPTDRVVGRLPSAKSDTPSLSQSRRKINQSENSASVRLSTNSDSVVGVVQRSSPMPHVSHSRTDGAPRPPCPPTPNFPKDARKGGKEAPKPPTQRYAASDAPGPKPPSGLSNPAASESARVRSGTESLNGGSNSRSLGENATQTNAASRRPLLNRAELRKRGQAALSRLRTNPAVNALPDRKRLIEEGRKLLKHAKATSPVAATDLGAQQASEMGGLTPKASLTGARGGPIGISKRNPHTGCENSFGAVALETDDEGAGEQSNAVNDDESADSGWGFQDDFDV